MVMLSCLALAGALVCSPGSPGQARLRALWPAARRRSPAMRAAAAGPVLAGAVAGFVVAGVSGSLAGGVLAAVARRRRARQRAAAEAEQVAEQLAEAVGRIGDELRTGAHPAAALAGIGADGSRARALLAPAAAAAALGDDVPAALRRAAAAHPAVAGDLTRLAAAWALAEQHGVPLSELLTDAQADLRWRVRFGAAVRAQLAGPRATATVLTALPLVGLGLGQLLGADPLGVLRGGVVGQVLVVVGVGFTVAGSLWSDHIVRAAMPR